MAAPVLALVTRSGKVESQHRGAVAVADGDGRLVAAAGQVSERFFFRSSAKPIQLLPTVESGAAEHYGLGDRELAVAASSHSGAPRHVEAVRDIVERLGLTPGALGCGYHDPRNRESLAMVLAAGAGARSPLYNNCSGKHAAMLVLAAHLGADPEGYLEPDHPAQRMIVDRVCELCGVRRRDAEIGIDGCSAPTLHAPLSTFAVSFARFGRLAAGVDLDADGPATGKAAVRIQRAMAARPEMLGEEDSFNTVLVAALGRRLIAKGGAEGLYCVSVPELDLGIAVRVEDGASRAVAPVVLDCLKQLGVLRDEEIGPLFPRFSEPELRNCRGTLIGSIRPTLKLTLSKSRRASQESARK